MKRSKITWLITAVVVSYVLLYFAVRPLAVSGVTRLPLVFTEVNTQRLDSPRGTPGKFAADFVFAPLLWADHRLTGSEAGFRNHVVYFVTEIGFRFRGKP